jgi:hypothetical protein
MCENEPKRDEVEKMIEQVYIIFGKCHPRSTADYTRASLTTSQNAFEVWKMNTTMIFYASWAYIVRTGNESSSLPERPGAVVPHRDFLHEFIFLLFYSPRRSARFMQSRSKSNITS